MVDIHPQGVHSRLPTIRRAVSPCAVGLHTGYVSIGRLSHTEIPYTFGWSYAKGVKLTAFAGGVWVVRQPARTIAVRGIGG